MSETKQFGRTQPVTFKIGNQTFEAAAEVSSAVMLDMANLRPKEGENRSHEDQIKMMVGIFEDVLSADSFERLRAGLNSRKKPGDTEGADPIGLHTIMEVVEWLFGEVYGERPTQKPQS